MTSVLQLSLPAEVKVQKKGFWIILTLDFDPSNPTPPHISQGIALIHWISTVCQAHGARCFVLALILTVTPELGSGIPILPLENWGSERLGDSQGFTASLW